MTPSPRTSISPNALTTIATLCATETKTLTHANEILSEIEGVLISLIGTPQAHICERILKAPDFDVFALNKNGRPRTLPQARECLDKIASLLGPIDSTETSGAKNSRAPAARAAQRSTMAAPIAKVAAADAQIFDRYLTLKGNDRQTYFSTNRETLIRENARRTTSAATEAHGDLVSRYMSLTGKQRADFYEKHSRELFEAHRARSKHAR